MHARLLVAALALAATLAAAQGASAQSWPTKPIRLIVGFASGGPTDTLARTVADNLTAVLPQPTVVENKPGAAGNLAAETAAKSPPDGHSLFLGAMGPFSVNQALYDKLGYDPYKDWLPITVVAKTPFLLSVNPAMPVKSIAEFIDHAKKNPGKINHSSPGVGTMPQLAAELFRMQAGFDSSNTQYRSSPLMLNAVIQGEVQWTVDVPLTSLPQYQTGKIRVLATTAPQRLPSLPDVPTLAELGFPDVIATGWFAVAAPAGTPAAIIDRLNAEIVAGLATEATKTRLAALGFDPAPMTPAQTAKFFADEGLRWTKVIQANNIRAE
jgi:tripartite-type tricarboxylate transporter receptor subunit TctC